MQNFSLITSKENSGLKLIEKLQKSSKARNDLNLFALEGQRICQDAIDTALAVEYVFVSNSFYDKSPEIVEDFFAKSNRNFVVKDHLFLKVCDTKTPQGIIIIAKKPDTNGKIKESGKYIALDTIQDTANLGAIARTAEALGISGIILNNTSCDPYSPKSLRASMGTILRMPIFITDDLPLFLAQNNLTAVSYVIDNNAIPISEIDYLPNDVIVIGNEANGISDAVKGASRIIATIPMSGKAQSLNAASAASIAIYDFTKR